jgi:hypothetical protein
MELSWALFIAWLIVIVVLNLTHILVWPKLFGKEEPLLVCILLGFIVGIVSWDIAHFFLNMKIVLLWGPSPAP